MLLCDVGNTSYHFYDTETGRDYRRPAEGFDPQTVKRRVYYICVNAAAAEALCAADGWVDIEPFVDRTRYYDTMGIDRIAACEAVDEGVIVDAGSAITVDVVEAGKFAGGFIVPGLAAMHEAYRRLSPRLDHSFNFDMPLDKMPTNSADALTYGAAGLLAFRVRAFRMRVLLTGGDAQKLLPLFPDAEYAPLLLFEGMQKIITKAEPC